MTQDTATTTQSALRGAAVGEAGDLASLRQSEVRLRSIVSVVQEAIQLWDAEGRQVFANPAAAAMFGLAGDNPLGQRACLHEDGSPFRPEELPASRIIASRRPINNLLMQSVDASGMRRWMRVNGQPVLTADGRLSGVVTSAADVTELIEHENQLKLMAHYDALTQLPNRVLLGERMRLTLSRSQRTGEMVAVCMLDLDGFKAVNDTLGHKAGDQLLREVARRLGEGIRADDTAARLGGDEFAILLCGIKKISECELVLTRLLSTLSMPYQVGEQMARVSASVGVTLFPDDKGDPDLLLRHADQAMYQAKQAGKNRFCFFDPGQNQRVQANQGMLRKIEKAIGAGQFVLFYQPKVNCRRGGVESVEALIRWNHPILGILSPSEFLPLIEQDDLIVTLGDWVIREALRQIAAWRDIGIDLNVSVNVSARQLHQRDFVAHLKEILAEHSPEVAQRIELEVVETAALEDVNVVGDVIRECRAMGLSVALDDFGTGYSSLVHLKRLPANVLKIDQTFVLDMLSDTEDLAIVEAVVGLASAFKRQAVAEGAESIDHVLLLLELGCNVIQGYGVARPMPAEKLTEWVQTFVPDPLWSLSSSQRPSRDYFEILLAEANHRTWIDKIVTRARQHENTSVSPSLDEHQCRFGEWYYNEGFRRYRHLEEFRAIEKVHHDIHQLAGQIWREYRDGAATEAAANEAALLDRHHEMVVLLRLFRLKLAQELNVNVY